MKREFSALTLQDAMQMVPQEHLTLWALDVPPRPPSSFLTEVLSRMRAFDLTSSDAAKLLLMDALFTEIVPRHPPLKIWKDAILDKQPAPALGYLGPGLRRLRATGPVKCFV